MSLHSRHLIRYLNRATRAVVIVALIAPLAWAQPAAEPGVSSSTVLSLDEAVAVALRENSRLAALGVRVDALDTVPAQAGALPDPMVGISAMNFPTDTFDFDQEPMTQVQLSFSQAIPFRGKRELMRTAAEFDAEAARSQTEDRVFTLEADVRTAWWKLFHLDRSLEIIEQSQSLMRDFVEIAQTKYRVGSGLQQDVLLAQLELSRLLDREMKTASMRSAVQSQLNYLLSRSGGSPIRLPGTPPNQRLPAVPPQAELLDRAVAAKPRLAAEAARVSAAQARLDLASKNLKPDFRVGMAYGVRDGRNPLTNESRPDFLSLNLSVAVPLYADSRQRKAIEQRSHEMSQRRHELNDSQRSVEAAIARFRFEYESAVSQVELVQSAIVPQAQQTVASMLAGYQTGQVDFLNVVNSQITLYNAQISYWESLSNAKTALAQLAAAVGEGGLYE